MFDALLYKVVPGTVAGRGKKGRSLPARVVKGDLTGFLLDVLCVVRQEGRRRPVTGVFGVVPVEVGNPIGGVPVAAPAQVLLLRKKTKGAKETISS